MGFFSRRTAVNTDEGAVEELLARGVEEAIVKSELKRKMLSGERLRVKLGIDPTSPDLHIGRAVPLLKLRDFQNLGHQIVFIVGDFTAVIGDTSDKEAERPMLTREAIEFNKRTYFEQAGKVLDLSQAEVRYNSEWLEPLTYREIGAHADLFSVADFIARENIAKRLQAGKRVSLREVLYPLMQGYDSVAVKADVEIGGTDQKFNLLAGRTMQEKLGQRPQDILMNPLVEGLDGRKMSSSWGNTIPLTASPADMYGKVMSMADEQIPAYFELCTRVPMDDVSAVKQGLTEGSVHPRDAKKRLAREITALYHGAKAAQEAEGGFMKPDNARPLKARQGSALRDIAPELGVSVSELRRLVSQGAIEEVGGEKLTSIDSALKASTLKVGKHRFFKIELV